MLPASPYYFPFFIVGHVNPSVVGRDGNMTEKVSKQTGDTTHYVYDIENRLIEVLKRGIFARYAYDALGRRVAKTVNGETTQFRYDGLNLILEMNADDSITASFTFGFGSDNPLSVTRSDTTLCYLKDALGSIVALTDSIGNVVTEYKYSAFGETVEEPAIEIHNPFMYTTREYDSETGNYYYRARYYEARLGRFLSADPVGGINLYSYVSNNPIMARDPLGLYATVGFNGNDWGRTRVSPLTINANCSEKSNSSSGACDATETKQYVLSGQVSVTATVLYIVVTVRNTSGTRECPRTAANIARTVAHEEAHVRTFISQAQSYSSMLSGVFRSLSECEAAKQQAIASIRSNWQAFLQQEQSCDPAGVSQLQESIDAGCE